MQTHSSRHSLLLVFQVLMGLAPGGAQRISGAELRIATFVADVTPAEGEGPCVGFMPRVESVEHPLLLKGVVLEAGAETCVIAAIDYCGICNSSDLRLREELAEAAGTTPERVALQSLHQHTAPVLDADAARILFGAESARFREHVEFTERIAVEAADAVRASLDGMRSVTRIACTKARVEEVASNRRVRLPDGSIGVRASLTRDADIRDADVGLIDPWLRTVSFFSGEDAVAWFHYYATHPQTFYGDGRISWDCVGMAREQVEQSSGVFTMYFTGCGGNITVGKFNDGTIENRAQLAERLLDAMRRSGDAEPDLTIELAALDPAEITWDLAEIGFAVRDEGTAGAAVLQQQLHLDQPFSTRLKAACFLSFRQRLEAGHQGTASRMRIGPLDIVHLPGEPFVEFQLFAQQNSRDGAFTCVAGYGDCGVWYYGPDTIYSDRGGYEQTWSLTGPCQASVEAAIHKLLQ